MNKVTIECKKITKSFGQGDIRVETLKGVDLVAHEREMIMLMGPSGSGKTTLISIIGGILQQDSGECLVLGTAINSLQGEAKTKFRGRSIGFMFQYFSLVPTLNAIENVSIPLMLNGYDRQEIMDRSSTLLQKMGLEAHRYRVPSELSGGEQQRVAIARACIHKPPIILCDEPTSFLDHERGEKIMGLLQEIKNENNCTIIVVTHDPRILHHADRILTIEDGMIKESNHDEAVSSLTGTSGK